MEEISLEEAVRRLENNEEITIETKQQGIYKINKYSRLTVKAFLNSKFYTYN